MSPFPSPAAVSRVFKSFKMMEAYDLCGDVVKYVPRMNGEEASSLVKQGRAA